MGGRNLKNLLIFIAPALEQSSNPSLVQPGAARRSQAQAQPGAARSSQEQPGAARSSQEQPGAARSSQQQPSAAQSSQAEPGAARRSRESLGSHSVRAGSVGRASGAILCEPAQSGEPREPFCVSRLSRESPGRGLSSHRNKRDSTPWGRESLLEYGAQEASQEASQEVESLLEHGP